MGGLPKYPQFPLRINPALIDKMRIIAAENSRSVNKEIEQLIIKYIRAYEEEAGEITQQDIDRFLDNQ